MQYLAIVIRCLIGSVFLASAVSKLAGRDAFRAFVASTEFMAVLPPRFAAPVARCVLLAEITICLLLAVPSSHAAVAGLALAAGLLVTFTIGIVSGLRRGIRVPCRCFGASSLPLGPWHVGRNVVLAAVATTGAAVVAPMHPAQPAGVALAAAGGLLLGGVAATLDNIVGLFQPFGNEAAGTPRGLG